MDEESEKLEVFLLTGKPYSLGEVILNRKGVRDCFLKKKIDLASRGKDCLNQMLMKSQNDSTSVMSFIFMYFGKKFGSQLRIQSLYLFKGKTIRFYQTKCLNKTETLPRSEMLHFKPKDTGLGLLVLTCNYKFVLSKCPIIL